MDLVVALFTLAGALFATWLTCVVRDMCMRDRQIITDGPTIFARWALQGYFVGATLALYAVAGWYGVQAW